LKSCCGSTWMLEKRDEGRSEGKEKKGGIPNDGAFAKADFKTKRYFIEWH